jgi:hypothetical protein
MSSNQIYYYLKLLPVNASHSMQSETSLKELSIVIVVPDAIETTRLSRGRGTLSSSLGVGGGDGMNGMNGMNDMSFESGSIEVLRLL